MKTVHNAIYKKIIPFLLIITMLCPLLTAAGLRLPAAAAGAESLPAPVLRYSFDQAQKEVDGQRYVTDESGNGFDGLMVGDNTQLAGGGVSGNKLVLKGFSGTDQAARVDSYVQLPDSILNGMTELTISTWVNFHNDGTNYWSRIFDIGIGTGAYVFVAKGGRASIGAASVNQWADIDAPVYADEVWTNITVTYSKNCLSYYINGKLYDRAEKALPDLSELTPAACAYIGKSQYAADTCLTADIDEFHIYNKAMTATEIQNLTAEYLSDQQVVQMAAEELDIGNTAFLTQDLQLPSVGAFKTNIAWETSNPDTISSQGVINTQGDTVRTATLTATISQGGASMKKDFQISVLTEGCIAYALNIDGSDVQFELDEKFSAGFFEDTITLDGGLCAELIENASFEFANPLASWNLERSSGAAANIAVKTDAPLNENNLHYMDLSLSSGSWARLTNDGFQGMTITKDAKYDFSCFARKGSYDGILSVYLTDSNGNVISDVLSFAALEAQFGKLEGTLTATASATNCKLCIEITSTGNVQLDMISLFPQSNFRGIENLFNAELVQYLADLNIKALRFPGGCVMEGTSTDGTKLENYNNWKYSVGPREERTIVANRWGGYQSNTVGYYEYFLLCEALGAEPIPVLNAGMSCQIVGAAYTVNDHTYYCPMDELDATFIQDALDLIEYCNGDETTYWGKKRIEAGHPEPFNLKYLAIGNEQFGEEYFKRYARFKEVISEKYPDIILVTTSGAWAEGNDYNYSYEQIKNNFRDDIIDEHFYMGDGWFLSNVNRYDSYDRDLSVYLGEYAVKNADGKSTLSTALAEAAFMTGLVKNGDVVKMHSYAPMFQRADSSIWSPALIWYNSVASYASAAYYNQLAFANNTGSLVLSSALQDNVSQITGGISLGSWQTEIDYDSVEVLDINGNRFFYDDFSAPTWTWNGPYAQEEPSANWGFYNAYDGTVSPVAHWWIGEGYVKTVDVSRLGDKLPLAQMQDTRFVKRDASDWNNYTTIVKASKFSGNEGFLICVGYKDNGTFYQFNVGGYNNTRILLEKCVNGAKSIVAEAPTNGPVVETGRQYELKVEVKGMNIKCYIDGQLVLDYTDTAASSIYQEATYDKETGEMIVKLVNVSASDLPVQLNLSNVNVHSVGKQILLKGDSPDAENSFANPNAVYLEESQLTGISNQFVYKVPANTLAILRIKVDHVTIEPVENDTLTADQTHQLTATSYTGSNEIMWSVSDETVATIDADGKLTAISAGQVTVTAKVSGTDFSASYTLTVTPAEDPNPNTSDPTPVLLLAATATAALGAALLLHRKKRFF